MNLKELNTTVMGLWPKCDWTPDEWGLLADTVKRVPADQAEAMLREVRRTQRTSRNPELKEITARVRAMSMAPATSGTFQKQPASKWEAQRAAWGRHDLSEYETFRLYWQRMRDKHAGPSEAFARMWHSYCAIDARELGASWNDAEAEAAKLTGGTARPYPMPHGDSDDLMEVLVNTTTPNGQPRVDVKGRRRQLRAMAIREQLADGCDAARLREGAKESK